MGRSLNPRQARFVAEYCVSLNATSAAIAAGYSEKSAEYLGYQLLQKPPVRDAIAAKLGKVCGKLEISAQRVLEELAKLAFYDPGDFFETDGSLKGIKELDADTRRAIAGLEVTELFEGKDVADGPQQKTVYGLLKKIKLTDKRAALELLGKYLKLFTDRSEISGPGGGAVQIEVNRAEIVSKLLGTRQNEQNVTSE